MSTLFKNCKILTYTKDDIEVISNGFLGVCGDKISYIGKTKPEEKYDYEKDMSDKMLMPGLINTHGHSGTSLIRGTGAGLPLQQWLFDYVVPKEDKMTPADVYVGNKMAILEMLAGGTTTVSDMYDFPYTGVLAYAQSGMRANVTRCGLCFDPNAAAQDTERYHECVGFVTSLLLLSEPNEEAKREIPYALVDGSFNDTVVKALREERIKPNFSMHSEYMSTDAFIKGICEINEEYKTKIHMHLSETEKEVIECRERHNGLSPVQYMEKMGLFKYGAYAAHCVWIDENDMDILAENKVSLSHNPTSNLKLGSGVSPIAAAFDKGINICLGTDGCASNNNLNMFEEINLSSLLVDGIANPLNVGHKKPNAIKMATVNGAHALGRDDTGILQVGKKADIIAINLDVPHLFGVDDVADLVKYSAQASDVCMTMVDGNILYENGEYFTMDREKIFYEYKKTFEIINR